MKLLAIAVVCLSVVLAEEKSDSSSTLDQLDVVELAKDSGETKSSEAQRKRDSGYSYTRPDRFSSSQRWELSGVRGRIVTKPPSGQTSRPFTRYGPPKQSGPHFGKPSGQYAPQHQYGAPPNRRPQQPSGQMHQEVPSPVRTYDFVEASPIASQNNEPFNSNAAAYLPPRNQKLPGYSTSQTFSNQHSTQRPENHQQTHQQQQHQQQNSFNNFQNQQLVQGHFQDQPQISDAALFLAENAQAISQLYEAPAANLNYEPIQNFQGSQDQLQNPNNQFQTFDVSGGSQGGQNQGLDDPRGFPGRLPSYASGVLDPQQTLQQIQSLEKDRLISQLQRDLVTAQGKVEGTASARYAQNHQGSFVQNQALLASFGTQMNPSIGPQLDRPNSFSGQKPFGASAFGGAHFLPTSTTSSGFLYGLQSTTPATQSPSTTTTVSLATSSSGGQRPAQGAAAAGSSQVGSSASAPGTAPTYPFLQYGGFVPTVIGNNLLASYPNYGTNFIGASSAVTPAQPAGSSPTHFGLPIPTLPAGAPGTGAPASARPPVAPKPQGTPGQHHQPPSTPVNVFHLQPVQPIHPIAATPVHQIYPIAPSVTQVHPGQAAVPVASGQPTYGLQPAVVNPLLIKPVKAVYPVYYYPNVYQIQKPAQPTYPWNYAPSFTQTKPGQAWK